MAALKEWDAMIDIETLDKTQDSVILSIGAVKFKPLTGEFHGEKFYSKLDITKQPNRTIGADTLKWWLEQDRAIFDDMTKGNELIDLALPRLRLFMADVQVVWANGVTFDIIILDNAFEKCGIQPPWQFWQLSCMRTLKNLVNPKNFTKKNNAKHNSLADAQWQAEWVIAALKHLKTK